MKNALFSPISWRKKKSFAEQQEELLPPTPTRSFLSSPSRQHNTHSPVASAVSTSSPRRPPRPPSLDLSVPPPTDPPSRPERGPPPSTIASRKPISVKPKRSMPELDGVWKGFLADVNEDLNLLHKHPVPKLPPLHHSNSDFTPNYRNGGGSPRFRPVLHCSNSVHNLSQYKLSSSPRSSISSGDSLPDATDFDSLALFPAPPPLRIRRKVPKPLVLQPSPSRSPTLPSSGLSSLESTPVTTPTQSQSFQKIATPPSILKSPSSPASHNYPVTPDSDSLAPEFHYDHVFRSRPGRIAHSLSSPTPQCSPMSTMPVHRSTASDTFALSRPPRYDKPLPPAEFEIRQRDSNSASEVEWGIAV